ncbi:heme-binding protein [Allorhodopirellula solitaria]|uniref:DUF306 domain-containing protein n=1 Tax=Allorhodopirellula solitaria TaxID=2527987 RepID=A0A5C5XQY0_9BACT|nr:heme-binding protein [Allorhodopirellula solitaria]TWT64763.1 hypothetical protein CA85_35480 [Allorhodopirellula solitaria]
MFRITNAVPTTRLSMLIAVLMTSSLSVSAQTTRPGATQPTVRRNAPKLTVAGAEQAIAAARQQAEKMGVHSNIAVVDEGGHLLAFIRMDNARPSSVYTAITKAASAATRRRPTGPLEGEGPGGVQLSLALENAAAASGGKFTTLQGGVPILCDDQVIGAIGVGGATGEQDAEVAAAGVNALTKTFGSGKVASESPTPADESRLIGKWLIEDIAGKGVVDLAQTTLEVQDDGSISGNTSVNRYFGKANMEGEQIQFGKMGATRRAGPPALMDQENKFMKAMNQVTRYQVDDRGLLHLFNEAGEELLRAAPME